MRPTRSAMPIPVSQDAYIVISILFNRWSMLSAYEYIRFPAKILHSLHMNSIKIENIEWIFLQYIIQLTCKEYDYGSRVLLNIEIWN